MSRIRRNDIGDITGANPITISSATATSCSWVSNPFPTIYAPFSLPTYMALTVDPNTAQEEVFWVTGWQPGGTTALIRRAPPGENYGTIAAHTSRPWVLAPTDYDYRFPATRQFMVQQAS
jgi:hypothetical protein